MHWWSNRFYTFPPFTIILCSVDADVLIHEIFCLFCWSTLLILPPYSENDFTHTSLYWEVIVDIAVVQDDYETSLFCADSVESQQTGGSGSPRTCRRFDHPRQRYVQFTVSLSLSLVSSFYLTGIVFRSQRRLHSVTKFREKPLGVAVYL